MKTTLSTNQVTDALYRDEYANWTYYGARALAEYLEEYEDSTGEEIELDVVAIRCDYAEYESGIDAAVAHGWDDTDGEEGAKEWLRDRTQVIAVEGGAVIIAAF